MIGSDLTTDVWQHIGQLDDSAWVRAIDQDGIERDHAHVAELAAPDGWGDGVRLIVRRELAHAGAPMRLLDLTRHASTHRNEVVQVLQNPAHEFEKVVDERDSRVGAEFQRTMSA